MVLLPQVSQLPSVDHMMEEHTLKIVDGRDTWRFVTLKPRPKYEEDLKFQRQEEIRKNNDILARFILNQGPFMESCRVKIDPGYPVIAVRAAFGLGSHWDTLLFGIRHGHLIKMGRPPAMNSHGPALWKGHRDIWIFDNFDRYEAQYNKEYRPGYVLMKVDRDFHLVPYRFIADPAPKVPTTIKTPLLD